MSLKRPDWMPQPLMARLDDLTPAAWLYASGTLFMLVSFALIAFQVARASVDIITLIAACLYTCALVVEAYGLVDRHIEKWQSKLVFACTSIAAAAAATGVGHITVQEATGQAPGSFHITVALLSPLSFIPVLALIVIALSSIAMLAGLLVGVPHLLVTDRTKRNRKLFWLATRLMACGSVVAVITWARETDSEWSTGGAARWVAAQSAYWFDMQPDPGCAPLEHDRVVRLNDDIVLVGRMTDAGPRFARRSCPLSAEADDALPPPASTAPG